ncbi:lipase family protein [Williamsia soli]|uniref:lipase family protein n=1 Tax=Williamsia soli TaxID=364929 RepID=UPI0027DD1583|nr:lipase family protein [Williamsia soli]
MRTPRRSSLGTTRGTRASSTDRHPIKKLTTALIAPAVALLAITACTTGDDDGLALSSSPSASPASSSRTPSSSLPPAPSPAERGDIVTQESFEASPELGAAGTLTRVIYRSTAGYGGGFGTEVSGVIAVPDGVPPPGGWPIVALGHGTTGTDPSCGPSDYPDLLGEAGNVTRLLNRGFVVAASDYQGLGTAVSNPRQHPYLEPRTVAFNMIDAVRAARNVVPDTSDRWAAIGASQGGQAAWASAEAAGDYGQGLEFVGAAALAPAADVSPITEAGVDTKYTDAQKIFIPNLVAGLREVYPDLDPGDYMRGGLAAGADVFTSCGPTSTADRFSAAMSIAPGDAAIADQDAADTIREILQSDALPARRADGPLFVAYGDQDTIILPAWTAAAVQRACAAGDVVEVVRKPDGGHTNLGVTGTAVDWISDRFADEPAPDSCPV